MTKIIDGKKLADKKLEKLKLKIEAAKITPCLAIVLIGDNPNSRIYVKRKMAASRMVGIEAILHELPDTITTEKLENKINELNNDDAVHGIILQLPLPKHIRAFDILPLISKTKDVDGFNPYNIGMLYAGEEPYFSPCTPLGILDLIKEYFGGLGVLEESQILLDHNYSAQRHSRSEAWDPELTFSQAQPSQKDSVEFATLTKYSAGFHVDTRSPLNDDNSTSLAGLHAVIVGRSNIVGKPLASLLLKQDMTVTICHSKTKNLSSLTKLADIVILASGRPLSFGKEYFTEKSFVIDVGITKTEQGKVVGDLNFDEVNGFIAACTKVPGGVGPMTVACLLENVVRGFTKFRN